MLFEGSVSTTVKVVVVCLVQDYCQYLTLTTYHQLRSTAYSFINTVQQSKPMLSDKLPTPFAFIPLPKGVPLMLSISNKKHEQTRWLQKQSFRTIKSCVNESNSCCKEVQIPLFTFTEEYQVFPL